LHLTLEGGEQLRAAAARRRARPAAAGAFELFRIVSNLFRILPLTEKLEPLQAPAVLAAVSAALACLRTADPTLPQVRLCRGRRLTIQGGSIGKEMGTVLHFRTIRLRSRGFKQI
jgi:hypothetical protein